MIDKLYSDLISSNHKVRDQAVLDLIDIIEKSKNILIKQITKKKNINNRGTLVYALNNFNCSENFSLLFDLLLDGNYEVFMEAYDILCCQRFLINDEELNEYKNKYSNYIENIGKIKMSDEEKNERLLKIKNIYDDFLL